MQNFGEMCIVTYKDNSHQAKLANQRTSGIWVGDNENHSTSTYWIFNTKTKKNMLTQSVTLLQKSYSEYTMVDKPVDVTTSYEGSDKKEEELETIPVVFNNNNVEIICDSDKDSNKKTLKTMATTFFMKTLMTKSKLPPKPLSEQKWYKP